MLPVTQARQPLEEYLIFHASKLGSSTCPLHQQMPSSQINYVWCGEGAHVVPARVLSTNKCQVPKLTMFGVVRVRM
eukprot:c45639_g1_i1 orf=43-270(+)